jgi:uncharacterized protein (TIGR02145 family)
MKIKITLITMMIISSLMINAQTVMNIHQSNGTVLQIPLNTIDSITYTIPNPGNLATLTTTAVSAIAETIAISGGNITNDGGSLITQRGICYSTSPSPTTANTTIVSGSGVGSFTSNFTGLTASTTYYVRAYATNSAGTAYGNELTFTTTAGGIVTNPGAGVTFDGYTYASIVLGNGQEWMSENLRTTTYANGDTIPNVTNPSEWYWLNTGCWVHYNNDSQYENPYGKLYNWYTVADYRNVCPTGWHVPSDAEWSAFINYLDPNAAGGSNPNIAGSMMISTGTQYWPSPNQYATNESGFSGLPGGFFHFTDGYTSIGLMTSWWSSEENFNYDAWSRSVHSGNDVYLIMDSSHKKHGLSVRCLRD